MLPNSLFTLLALPLALLAGHADSHALRPRVAADEPQTSLIASSFSFQQDGNDATFQYSTTEPHGQNWIGIYTQNGGPVDQVQVEQSLAWTYTPDSSGTARIAIGSLSPGRYRAFFLAQEGYVWLTSPIYIEVAGGSNGTSSFSLNANRPLFTFDYSTSQPHAKNWIGIYTSTGGPMDQVQVEAALKWAYAPASSGSVAIPADDLPGGSYRAFFLAQDGYRWLTSPIVVKVAGISFPRGTVTLRNAKVGVAYSASVGGLTSASATFSKVSGPEWVSVNSSGALNGTPTSSGITTVTVRASGNDATAELVVTIPVRSSGDCLVQNVHVMTYNMWAGGSRMNNYHQKQLRALIDTNVDIVGLQEADPNRASELAKALGWYYWASAGNARNAVLSRYPLAETYDHVGVSVAARVALDGSKQEINVWTTHLTAYPYGPYEACNERKTVQQILATEDSSGRTGQVTTIVNAMRAHIAAKDAIPVLLLGDFNAPSHLDWSPALQSKNCGYANIQWPTSRIPTEAGLIDSFRVHNPNPVMVQGTTWSPIYPFSDGATGRPEPQDRIDYIYHAGNVQVLDSRTYVLGKPSPVPGHTNNEWTSDHAAVLTQYKLNSGTC
ncbi:exonuclease III [Plectosphaerella plurivora]|uniref:Exonuclease III n=1 Tax=Plectosphaerella plurivora TaxID=936078 RepID=A0A9P8VL68_9PEZI|nr:exonuclease III [Plectosphaerella plurivora]